MTVRSGLAMQGALADRERQPAIATLSAAVALQVFSLRVAG